MINDDLGNPTSELAKVFTDYYKQLLGTEVELEVEEEYFDSLNFKSKADSVQVKALSRPILDEEIHEALFSMDENKSHPTDLQQSSSNHDGQ